MSKQNKKQREFLEGEIGAEFESNQKSKLVERANDSESTKQKSEHLENYYELKTDAIERLVTANEQNSPEITDKTQNPYSLDKLSRIPTWIKVCCMKWWFAGAVCFFFYWGLGTVISNENDKLLVLSLAMGITVDIFLNNILRHFQSADREYDRWMMLPMRKLWSFFVSMIYGAVLTWAVAYIYQGINTLAVSLNFVEEGVVFLGVEPLLFGLFFLGCDCLCLLIKNSIKKLIKNANQKEKLC